MVMLRRHFNAKQLLKIKTNPSLLFIGLGVVLAALYIAVFIAPIKVLFSYGGETCVDRLILLPSLYKQVVRGGFVVTSKEHLGIGNFAWLSTKQCIRPIRTPTRGVAEMVYSPFGSLVFAQHYQITTPEEPTLAVSRLSKPIIATKTLHIPMSKSDETFLYTLRINDQVLRCASSKNELLCPVQRLNLAQGTSYDATITRGFFDQDVQSIYTGKVMTLSATKVVDTSIKPDETVYSKPSNIVINFDKPVTKALFDLVRIQGDSREKIEIDQIIDAKTLTASLPVGVELAREAEYEATVHGVEAVDGSALVEPYVIKFHVSGGPTVTGISIGKTGVGSSDTIVVSFDQALSPNQDIGKIISFVGGNASIIRDGSQVKINLRGLPKCADFTIVVMPGLQSMYGIESKQKWSYAARTSCYTVSTIGYSTRGRAINAYYFGNGSSTVLFVGAIHGNEASSSYILRDWIAYLDTNARSIPTDRQIVVVPTVNPDGLTANSRMNANGVNLNRNFTTADWQKDINDTGGAVANGGGAEPMSENETKALANLTAQLQPRLVLSYHAVGSVTIGNGRGVSGALAGTYASMVGYSNGTGNSSEIFTYEISGTYDDWVAERLNVPSIVVELGSYTYRNFDHHRPAMWKLATS